LGIGLSLAKGLVDMHGGTIAARSEGPGHGSEFVIRLPLLVERKAAKPLLEQSEEAAPPNGARYRILVVDDNEDSRGWLATMLEMMGNEVRTAHDGEAGIVAAAEFRPDLILMDIGMPKMNGYEAARRIRQEPWGKQPMLVALTGWGSENDRRQTQEAGFNHHLVKPVDPAEIKALLAELPTS
jgi:CheY-like chemotaxis protein